MILTAHQPVYLPWLGLFHKISLADVYCVYDIVQYQTYDYNNRNKIKTSAGELWLSVPVESKGHLEKRWCDLKITPNGWNKKHFKSIYYEYRRSEFFDRYIGGLEKILMGRAYEYLTDLNYDILVYLLECLGMKVSIVKASDHSFRGTKSDLVLDMCVKLGAKKFIFGKLGRDYAKPETFREKGIEIYFQDYRHPVYRQRHGQFAPYLSVIDLLFNEGPASKGILLKDNVRREEI